uniref:Uncharacterized protein n=1 Tax=Ditylum brightwellii TaxID=49249 RepID=A0A7S4WAQ8_9STRA
MKLSVNQPKKDDDDDESVIEPPCEDDVEEQRLLAPSINETHSALRPSSDVLNNDPSTTHTSKRHASIEPLSKMKTEKKLYNKMFRKSKAAKKIPNDMSPAVDPDNFRVEEPPFPFAEDQHPQVDNQVEAPPFPYREDEGNERPDIGNHAEEPPVPLGDNTVPNTRTFEVPDAQIPSDDLPTAHTINGNGIITPEAVHVEPPVQAEAIDAQIPSNDLPTAHAINDNGIIMPEARVEPPVQAEAINAQIPPDDLSTAHNIDDNDIIVRIEPPVQAEAIETMATNPEFVFLRKQNRVLLFVVIVIIVGLLIKAPVLYALLK